ncbi:MAG TPA: hypothetical protein VK919_07920 [Solirubrobacterales bacterium]|nr:hypothetical protein [Solirubrobacterales bacterium]
MNELVMSARQLSAFLAFVEGHEYSVSLSTPEPPFDAPQYIKAELPRW